MAPRSTTGFNPTSGGCWKKGPLVRACPTSVFQSPSYRGLLNERSTHRRNAYT